jgi:hypothetical protein
LRDNKSPRNNNNKRKEKTMDKQTEIHLLRTCAETLGPDSYCGPWLMDQIPQIESDIRSDLFPTMTYAETRAEEIGAEAGRNTALWVIQDTWGGRVTRGEKRAAAAFLRALDEGDFAAMPEPPNLSGEWSGDETPASLMESLFGEDWQDVPAYVEVQDVICQAWEDGANEGFYSSLCESAQSVIS